MKPVLAAGAVVTREHPTRGTEVVIIHRKRYGDWTLPKGKVDAGESVTSAAVREVREETGAGIRLGTPLDTVRYLIGSGDKAGEKEVRFWTGTLLELSPRPPDHEVDVVTWLPLRAAMSRLTYAQDHYLVHQHTEQPPTTPLILLRHAKAMDRKDWSRADSARPLGTRGRRQADRLVPMLSAYGVTSLVSSSSTRCVDTLRPYARAVQRPIEEHGLLSEEQGTIEPDGVTGLLHDVRDRTASGRTPTVVCFHRPVLPTMLEALGLAPASLSTGEMLVAHLTAEGDVHAVERHRPQR